jgi:hypothetical protein
VPLASQAVRILRQELYPLTGHRTHVFVGRDPKKPISEAAVNAALRRTRYDTKTEITGHGIIKKRLNLTASLDGILQILSLTMFEQMPLDQLLRKNMRDENLLDAANQLVLFD